MDISLLTIYVITTLMLIATPGPVVFLVVNTALKSGPYRAFGTILGTNWASLVLIFVAVFIISTSLVISPKLFHIISLFGCLFIGYIAISSIREALEIKSLATTEDNIVSKTEKSYKKGGLLSGFLVGLSNPKDIIFFVSFFPQFIKITDSFNKSIFLLTLLWVLLDFIILGIYILFIRKLATDSIKNIIVLISGVVLLVIASTGFIYSLAELIM
ncbi:LysE family translocator [Entomomonas asaccharolytica]|uniref:LysE family translocator n=1 Tax=Entomomonas asaccharolytica TaxID=2785331 RepID=A0A974RZ48_9GAMM|nr:LysE family translocator [Entomomonas asaccharolytica]QQP86674.1 LysE family translocator [Entomomonas asaccharolytica]